MTCVLCDIHLRTNFTLKSNFWSTRQSLYIKRDAMYFVKALSLAAAIFCLGFPLLFLDNNHLQKWLWKQVLLVSYPPMKYQINGDQSSLMSYGVQCQFSPATIAVNHLAGRLDPQLYMKRAQRKPCVSISVYDLAYISTFY